MYWRAARCWFLVCVLCFVSSFVALAGIVVIFLMCLLHPRHCFKRFVISFHSHNSSMKWILLLLPCFSRGKEAKGGWIRFPRLSTHWWTWDSRPAGFTCMKLLLPKRWLNSLLDHFLKRECCIFYPWKWLRNKGGVFENFKY